MKNLKKKCKYYDKDFNICHIKYLCKVKNCKEIRKQLNTPEKIALIKKINSRKI